MYLKLKYGDFLLIDIVYENGPIKFFCISAVLMLDVSIDTGLRTVLHLISIYKYIGFVVFDVFDRKGIFHLTLTIILFSTFVRKPKMLVQASKLARTTTTTCNTALLRNNILKSQ